MLTYPISIINIPAKWVICLHQKAGLFFLRVMNCGDTDIFLVQMTPARLQQTGLAQQLMFLYILVGIQKQLAIGMDGTILFSLSCEFTEVGYMPSDKDWEACIYQLDEAGRPGEDVTFNMEEDEVPSTVRPFVVLYTTHALKKVSCVPWPCADHCPIVLGRSLHHFDLLLLFVCNGLQKRRSDGLRAQDVAVF